MQKLPEKEHKIIVAWSELSI